MNKSKSYPKAKNGCYYARVAVPSDLRDVFGKGEILEPLGTDRALAEKQLVHAAVAMIRRKFDVARSVISPQSIAPPPKARPTRSLSPEKIAVLS